MASLSDIYKSEKSQGGGLGSAIGKSMKESLDPRNLLNQDGLLTSMFPSMKGYSALGDKKKDKGKKGSSGGSGNSPSKASFDEVLSNLGTKTTFERLQKAQVMSMKYTSVLPEMSKDLKNINKLLKAMIDDSGGGGGILDTILDALGLGDMFGKRKVRPGARERLKRIQAIKAARVAGAAGAASAVPKSTPTPEVKPNAIQGKGSPPAGAKWDEKANRWRGANGRFVKAEIPKETLKGLIKGKVLGVSGKIIPGLGIGFGLYDIYQRIGKGDYTGIGIAAGSAVASLFPGIGTGVAIAGTAANLARDVYEEAYGVYPEKDDEGDVQEKYKELLDMMMEELTGKNVQPLSEEQYKQLIPKLQEASNTTRDRRRILLNRPGGIYDEASKLSINRDTVDNEMQNIKNEKAAVIQDEQSKLLEQLSSSVKTAPTPSETPAASPTPVPQQTSGASGSETTPGSPVDFPTAGNGGGSGVTLEPPTASVPTPPTASLDTSSTESKSLSSGQQIAAISASVGDAQMAAASTPIVTSVPAKSSMNTPPSDSVDMTRLPIASVYNDEFMTEFFGSRQQSFATG